MPVWIAVGSSLSRLTKTMMPAIAANVIPSDCGPRNGWRSKYPTMAPNGSARPDRVAHQAALRRDPVASRIGTATAMPSGMLWIAIATARGIARAGSASATANVANPFREVVDGDGNGTEDAHVA